MMFDHFADVKWDSVDWEKVQWVGDPIVLNPDRPHVPYPLTYDITSPMHTVPRYLTSETAKLWLLQRRWGLPYDDDPWRSGGAKDFMVVRAETEEDARRIATENGGDEVTEFTSDGYLAVPAWSDAKYSTCIELTAEGEEGAIL